MHKFILGNNPIATKSGGNWIIHLPNPKSIIEIVPLGEKVHSKNAVYFKNYDFINKEGLLQTLQLRLYHYFTTDFDERKSSDLLANRMLDNAWFWYKSILEA